MASARSLFLPLVAIIIGTFMVILDTTVVNVALPTLGRVFATDISLLQWVIGAYLLAQAAVIPLSGWISDRFGAKRVYLISLVLFTAGSAICGLALNGQMLIATRVVQGLGGGMLMPIGMAVLYRLTPPERRGAIFGLFGLPLMVAPALGPLLSGYLLEFADWRLIFLINVPIGAVALLLELRVFRSRDFTLAILTQWAGFGAMFGSFFLVPLFLQQVRGYGSFETGLFTFPQAVASAIFMQISGRAFDRFGVKPPVV